MAGRGTDIVLGGSLDAELAGLGDKVTDDRKKKVREEWQVRHNAVIESGGLHIIGTERHESRRIDNQLRGRSGRQGDPGSSRFYLSLEDNLMRIFASDRMSMMMQRFGMKEDEAIEAGMLNRAIENAQRKVEAHNFDIRKHLLEYDNVANDQRRVVYQQRSDLMELEEIHDTILDFRENVFENVVNRFVPPGGIDEQWDVQGLETALEGEFGISVPLTRWLGDDELSSEEVLRQKVSQAVANHFEAREAMTGTEVMRHFEKALMLNVLDQQWKDHLASMDYLRQGIHLRGYAQKQPMQEYKRESFEMFTGLLDNIQHEVVRILARVQVRAEEDVEAVDARHRTEAPMQFRHEQASAVPAGQQASEPDQPFVREGRKVGRNEPCPCGSGKKFKQCHGKLQ
jgi:preprotein translocase subunit SecA